MLNLRNGDDINGMRGGNQHSKLGESEIERDSFRCGNFYFGEGECERE